MLWRKRELLYDPAESLKYQVERYLGVDERNYLLQLRRFLGDGGNEVYRPLMFGDSHLFSGASSGASCCIGGFLSIKNSSLRSEFGGYTAHHFNLVLAL